MPSKVSEEYRRAGLPEVADFHESLCPEHLTLEEFDQSGEEMDMLGRMVQAGAPKEDIAPKLVAWFKRYGTPSKEE